jgi:hypothetical protein
MGESHQVVATRHAGPGRAEGARVSADKEPGDIVQHVLASAESGRIDVRRLTPRAILTLQRTAGNAAVNQLLGRRALVPMRQAPMPALQRSPAPGGLVPVQRTDVVLSADPTYAKNSYLAWFRDRVKAKIESWGLPFDPASVTLKTDAPPGVRVLLTWNAAWGTEPSTAAIPFSLEPIDARAAVAAVHGLAGWAKVVGGDQTILDNMLGGETNELSAAARDHLRGMFTALKTKSDTDQAQALKALISAKDAMPGVVAEPVTAPKVEFTLDGPTALKDYAFKGKTADAEQWKAKYKDGVDVTITAPKAPEPGFHNHTVQQAADAASYLPKAARALITNILLNAVTNPEDPHWAAEYHQADFHSYMTAGVAGIVTIYPDPVAKDLPSANYMRGTMAHETGHTWSYKTWGTDKTKGKWLDWKKAMDDDKASVSKYATNAIAEDVGETIQVYVTTKGSAANAEYRKIVPHRFAMLDTEYK